MQQIEIQWGPQAQAIVAAGPRRCEELLLESLDPLLTSDRAALLARPVRLVVPSESLRRHVLERVLAHFGRAVVGLDCRTHRGLALEITRRAGRRATVATDLYPLFARRLARAEPALQRTLDHLTDGYAAILSAVEDLLEAGLEEAHVAGLEEVLASEGPAVATHFEVERAQSLIRVAGATSRELESRELGRGSHLLREASALLQAAPELLPSRAVVIYGYNDATGLTTDFLIGLVRAYGGRILLDDPPDPTDPGRADSGVRFAAGYRERLDVALGLGRDAVRPEASEPSLFRAHGGEAEVREVAERVRALLDAGGRPERIGVVARRLAAYQRPLRVHFDRLGVPFSALGARGPLSPELAPVGALLDLLRLRERAPIERWLDARALDPKRRNELALGFSALGVARLFEAAALEVGRYVRSKGLPLPVRSGFVEGEKGPRARHRYLATRQLEEAAERARKACRELEAWQAETRLGGHLERLRSFLRRALGWRSDSAPALELGGELDTWSEGLPAELEIDFAELIILLGFRLRQFGTLPLGGDGGGVQVLDVTEARSRTFEHLFVMGLNRAVFPRVVQEDALLPDRLRDVIGRRGFGPLPDLHRKLPGFDEERYLFAQLLAASPHVTLSWIDVDDEHVLQTPSPLVERIRWAAGDPRSATRDPVWAPGPYPPPADARAGAGSSRLRPAFESAVLAGLHGDRAQLAEALAPSLRETARRFDSRLPTVRESRVLAAARVRVLAEIDPVRGTELGEMARARLGPYFGFVGSAAEPADPRQTERLFVTTLERVARCPWRAFVERVLRIEPLPDPLEVLPGVTPLLIGNVVHQALEEIVERALPSGVTDLEQARATAGVEIPWPDEPTLEEVLQRKARAVAFDQGITLPGFDRVLASVGRAHLAAARDQDWSDSEPVVSWRAVLASEVSGELAWPEPPARIGFKADRLDRDGERLLFTDYKTGRGLPNGSSYPKPVRKRLEQSLLAGTWLQAAAYARAGGGDEDAGRYLFTSPTLDPSHEREVVVAATDERLMNLFERAIRATLRTWQRGEFFPRFVKHSENAEPTQCNYCAVAEACLRGDSGARGRLKEWAAARRDAGPDPTSVLATWYLEDPRFG